MSGKGQQTIIHPKHCVFVGSVSRELRHTYHVYFMMNLLQNFSISAYTVAWYTYTRRRESGGRRKSNSDKPYKFQSMFVLSTLTYDFFVSSSRPRM